ncbi:MAG TPA: ABC transporter ATP-binding protein [Aestuariivirga sp.]|nr:ABC transporter ATP-binding protein [Aestuariivirga sp.]
MSAGVELSDVSMDFGSFRAVDHADVNVKPGEFFSFLGPSGCGKTTILRMISGFMEPTQGSIKIGGQDMRGIGPNRRPTVLIFQNLALFPLMPVWENIGFGLEVRGVDKNTRRAKVEELLNLVDLPGAADKAISQLSGGQKQRVAIARALAVEPKVMLLDEPLSALDLKLRQHMRAELRAIQKRTNVTFIYITHDQGEALAMSDRVAVMSQGKIQQVGIPQEIYNNPVNGFVASFVGENNIFAGELLSAIKGSGKFKTASGTFDVAVGQGVSKSTPSKLYIRPEYCLLTKKEKPGGNSIAVEVVDVAFEGNFINIRARDATGKNLIVESRNDTSQPPPEPGTKLYFAFDSAKAFVLADRSNGAVASFAA